jgi:hypothetical protein
MQRSGIQQPTHSKDAALWNPANQLIPRMQRSGMQPTNSFQGCSALESSQPTHSKDQSLSIEAYTILDDREFPRIFRDLMFIAVFTRVRY